MSRGLSKLQERIVESAKERGNINIFQVADLAHQVFVSSRLPEKDRSLALTLGRGLRTEARQIRQVGGLYRALASLERRGVIASLLGCRPREWYHVEWDGDTPHIRFTKGKGVFHYMDGIVLYRTKGAVYKVTRPPKEARKPTR